MHSDRQAEAAHWVSTCFGAGIKIAKNSKPEKYQPVLMNFLHHLMENGGMPEAAALLWPANLFTHEPQSVQSVWELFDTSSRGLIMGAAKMGKCLGPDDLCRRLDGGIVRAGDIKVGDLLMGDDGTPRHVLNTVSGTSDMFRIEPDKAPAFLCNADHILSLICTWERGGGYKKGTIVDVSVKNYLLWSKQQKRAFRLFVAPVVLPPRAYKVDPYVYGAWLGDGTRVRCELTTPDGPMLNRWKVFWTSLGFDVEQQNKPITWCVRPKNRGDSIWPTKWVQGSVVNGEKRIKEEYLQGSVEQRMALLAGIIDADGECRTGSFDVATKWKGLAEDIERLARSLGFLCRAYKRTHSIKSIAFSAEYWHIDIAGNIGSIPTLEKVSRKKATKTLANGKATTRFTVTPIGPGQYAGFSLDGNHRFQLASGIVTHNSFSMGVRFFLEWIRDPEYTTLRVLGPSEDHLEQNLFSHLVALHKSASLPMPGEIGELFIGLSRREQMSSIKGVVIPKGNVKKAGRLQGGHRRPRATPHPIFGPLSRMFIFLDEIENIPNGVWLDIDNVLSEIEKGVEGFKIFGAYNPTNPTDEVGKRAEPPFGWNALDEDVHFRWKSVRGWDVLRLDGERCENVLAGKIIFPGLQTREGLEAIALGAGGRNAPGYLTMGRGMYPSMGVEATVIPAGMLPKMRGEFIWYDPPQPVSAVDLALEGKDEAVYTLGRFGKATGVKYPPSLDFPDGQTVMFKDRNNQPTLRWGLQADQQIVLPKSETVGMKKAIMDMNRKAGVRPEFFACDRTGHGAGVADLIKYEWSSTIHDVNFSESAGEEKLMQEDSRTCKELYERMYSVLWFATRQWGEFGYLVINPRMDLSKLTPQLTNRRFKSSGGKAKVESKVDFESRGFTSPNDADSLTLLVHAARKGSGLVLSRKGELADMPPGMGIDDDWPSGEQYPGGARIDESNKTDFLDQRHPEAMAEPIL